MKLETKFKKMFKCDTVRISKVIDRLFLIIGFKKHTKNDKNSFYSDENGNRIDFEYVEEKCIASGKNEKQLMESAKYYKKLLKIDWKTYFKNKMWESNKRSIK